MLASEAISSPPLSDLEATMPIVTREITIEAPPEEVWDLIADVDRQPEWMHDLQSVEFQEPRAGRAAGELRVGDRALGMVRMFGIMQADPVEWVNLDRPRHYAIRHLGAFEGIGEFRLEPRQDGRATRVQWREALHPTVAIAALPSALAAIPGAQRLADTVVTPLLPVIDRLVWPLFATVFRADLRRLKRQVEAQRDDSRVETP